MTRRFVEKHFTHAIGFSIQKFISLPNETLPQLVGGAKPIIAGLVFVQQTRKIPIEHYTTLGYIVIVISIITWVRIYGLSSYVWKKIK